ncbi:hypothetical protein CK203_064887 [Vitis vinifera]|uniref:Uncharacterized protein n=1 Tax=Vitis vinifera TaxID=29760 RepID=A0A438FQ58_VITVI|nr:hypothetical protein CK203_064887 [Vitis vinifera]
MARTRGAKSSSPSSRLRIPRKTSVQAAISESPRPPVVPPLVEDEPMSPPVRRYQTRRARPFHSELYFDIATFRLQPKLRDSFRLLQKVPYGALADSEGFFYPRVALDFYQSMTTH